MALRLNEKVTHPPHPWPYWLKQPLPDSIQINKLKKLFRDTQLQTICQSALCPNLGHCWQKGVATFLILGNICTRRCRFCAVSSGHPLPVDRQEPCSVALAVKQLNLKYVVITSVTRDDLADQGAEQFVSTVNEIRRTCPDTKIELLVPDFFNQINLVQKVGFSRPEVIGHNLETVERLYPLIRPETHYRKALQLLTHLKSLGQSVIKSGVMVGLGETKEEVVQTLEHLIKTGCDIVTIGQYLAPAKSSRHIPVNRFVHPEEFKEYEKIGLELGFKHVMSGPLVRSSFMAEETYSALTKN